VRFAKAHASTDGESTTEKRCSQRHASPRLEQPPLPTLAGSERIAEDVASHDGSLSTFRRPTVNPRRRRGRRVRPCGGSLIAM
jgi:hypothetical protein